MVYPYAVDGAGVCCLTKIILNSMTFIYLLLWYLISFKNKSKYSKAFFEKKSFSNSRAAESGIRNDPDLQAQNMCFPIKHLLREYKHFFLI